MSALTRLAESLTHARYFQGKVGSFRVSIVIKHNLITLARGRDERGREQDVRSVVRGCQV